MILLDTNVVLAAQRSDHPHHGVARPWLAHIVDRRKSFGVPATVWASFGRLTTDRRVFREPTPIADAFAFIRAVVGQPGYQRIEAGERHVEVFQAMCIENEVAGGLVVDAHLAALAVENGAALASFDRDFARFSNLEWILPTSPGL